MSLQRLAMPAILGEKAHSGPNVHLSIIHVVDAADLCIQMMTISQIAQELAALLLCVSLALYWKAVHTARMHAGMRS